MKVAVIGAGIVGASFAYHLSISGAQTILIDGGRAGGGTSTATAAYLNHLRKEPDHYAALHLEAIAYWKTLVKQLDVEHALHLDGALYWSDKSKGSAGLEDLAQRSRAWGQVVQQVELPKIEPSLKAPYSEPPYRVSDEGWVEVAPVIERLISAAKSHGLETIYQQPVTAIEHRDGQVHIWLGDDHLVVDQVVLAAGPGTEDIGRMLGLNLPVRQNPGIIAITAPQSEPLKHVVMSPGFSCRPDGGGRLLISVGERYSPPLGVLTPDENRALREELQVLLERWIPGAAGVPVEAIRVGVRPIPADDLPIVGHLPHAPHIYLAVSHSAINLAPLFGLLGSEEILTSSQHASLTPLRPTRFSL